MYKLLAAISQQSKNPDAYDLGRFKINWSTKRATCPQQRAAPECTYLIN